MRERIPFLSPSSVLIFVVLPLLLAATLLLSAGCNGPTADRAAPSQTNTEPIPEAKDQDIHNLGVAGYAKLLCSSVFVTGMQEAEAIEHSRRVVGALVRLPAADFPHLSEEIDHGNRLVKATLRGTLRAPEDTYYAAGDGSSRAGVHRDCCFGTDR